MIVTAGNCDDLETVRALGMDGKLLWKSPNGKAWHGPSPGSRTTPTYDDGTFYQLSARGTPGGFCRPIGPGNLECGSPGDVRHATERLGFCRERGRRGRQGLLHARRH